MRIGKEFSVFIFSKIERVFYNGGKSKGSVTLNGGEIDTLLAIIEKEMKDASTERQAVMNNCLVEIAVKYPASKKESI